MAEAIITCTLCHCHFIRHTVSAVMHGSDHYYLLYFSILLIFRDWCNRSHYYLLFV